MKIIAAFLLQFLIKYVIDRPYDFLVDYDYMWRWYVIPRNRFFNIYFHEFVGSDSEVMHDHPWFSVSFILDGQYVEHTLYGDFFRKTGSLTFRSPKSLHWIEIQKPVLTLFITGPVVRDWGFLCGNKWIHNKEYLAKRGPNRKSNGC